MQQWCKLLRISGAVTLFLLKMNVAMKHPNSARVFGENFRSPTPRNMIGWRFIKLQWIINHSRYHHRHQIMYPKLYIGVRKQTSTASVQLNVKLPCIREFLVRPISQRYQNQIESQIRTRYLYLVNRIISKLCEILDGLEVTQCQYLNKLEGKCRITSTLARNFRDQHATDSDLHYD